LAELPGQIYFSDLFCDLLLNGRPSRLAGFNPDTDTSFNVIDKLVASGQFVAIDRLLNHYICGRTVVLFNELPISLNPRLLVDRQCPKTI